ncbi:MAG: hypothetical protein ACYTEL_23360 [Planctomycetota bacterium]|jgi:hypothetical protein
MSNPLVDTWRSIIVGSDKSWVLFKNGTCVVVMEPRGDLAGQAVDLMKEFGPVYPGSPAGDFSVIALDEHPGWVVTCHHADILTYVMPNEVGENTDDVSIGLLGRSKRAKDADQLQVVHVEDRHGGG